MRNMTLFLLAMAVTAMASAQSLPEVQKDRNIERGMLPNGLTYYIASNKASHGYADYAIVQKKALDPDTASGALISLPMLGGIAPYEFLAKKGVGYGPDGFFMTDGRSSLFKFSKVPVSDVAASDTTLMMLFGLCSFSPYEQAIVVSGDVDVSNLKGKMSIFSLLVTPREKAPADEPYVWNPAPGVSYESELLSPGKHATFSIEYRTSRIPDGQLCTVQTLVNRKLFDELSIVLSNHIRAAFRNQNIALTDLRTEYMDCAASPGDQTYTISVTVNADELQDAISALSEVLYRIDTDGIGMDEVSCVVREHNAAIVRTAADFVSTNDYYVDKCVSNYLYGTDLGSPEAPKSFFLAKDLPMEVEHNLLNNFASALIDPSDNVKLVVSSPKSGYSRAEISSLYQSAWNSADSEFKFACPDTLLKAGAQSRVKIKSEVEEPMSKGEMWTFSNGVKVIYKRIPNASQLYYALLIKGGYADLKGLGKGEGPYLSDALDMMGVAGMTPLEYKNRLRSNGIFMDMEVSLSDMRIYGSAPSGRIDALMAALFEVAGSRTADKASFDYYKACEELKLDVSRKELDGCLAEVDRIIRPDFPYSPYKTAEGLTDALAVNAGRYLDRQFSRVNDGVFILMGDLDPVELKKTLCRYIGGFSVGKAYSVRPDIMYSQKTGWSSYTMEGDQDFEGSVNVSLSTVIPVTAKRYMAFKVAQLIFSRELANALKRYGMWTEIEDNVEFLPTERLSMLVSCHPTQGAGLPSGVRRRELSNTLPAVRVALEVACSKAISAEEMKTYKAILLNQIGYDSALNGSMMQMLMLRYSQGKDLVSQYKENINSLTPEDIREVLTALNESSKVEFIVK